MNHFWVGASWDKNDQVLDSDPKINPHPLLYIWGYFSSFLNPENVTTGTIKKVSKFRISLWYFFIV